MVGAKAMTSSLSSVSSTFSESFSLDCILSMAPGVHLMRDRSISEGVPVFLVPLSHEKHDKISEGGSFHQ